MEADLFEMDNFFMLDIDGDLFDFNDLFDNDDDQWITIEFESTST